MTLLFRDSTLGLAPRAGQASGAAEPAFGSLNGVQKRKQLETGEFHVAPANQPLHVLKIRQALKLIVCLLGINSLKKNTSHSWNSLYC